MYAGDSTAPKSLFKTRVPAQWKDVHQLRHRSHHSLNAIKRWGVVDRVFILFSRNFYFEPSAPSQARFSEVSEHAERLSFLCRTLQPQSGCAYCFVNKLAFKHAFTKCPVLGSNPVLKTLMNKAVQVKTSDKKLTYNVDPDAPIEERDVCFCCDLPLIGRIHPWHTPSNGKRPCQPFVGDVLYRTVALGLFYREKEIFERIPDIKTMDEEQAKAWLVKYTTDPSYPTGFRNLHVTFLHIVSIINPSLTL
ncbi:hypothetical protein FRB99_006335 [Tulasnella sp. 403]|nr:hypothetical protein FRB99_006335 [Tulasnella sp. 403]